MQLHTVRPADDLAGFDQKAIIKVCGVGGGGGNAVSRMIEEGLSDVEFIAINTDAQALRKSPAGVRLQIGSDITGGLGSGAKPTVGQKAAEQDRERLTDIIGKADMVFVTAGLGGGTGTGAAPIVAEVARNNGALTVGIITLPFGFEGQERMENALKGLELLEKHVDTLIVVPNDRVAQLCENNMSLLHAFKHADEVLHNGVRAISELITVPGLINLDFADVRTIMQARGRALMGIGVASGEDRAIRAAQEAIVCPLLEQSNIDGALGVIANVKGGRDIKMREVQDAVSTVQRNAHPDANIIFGAVVEEEEREEVQVTVIAAGFAKPAAAARPVEIQTARESFELPKAVGDGRPATAPAAKPAPGQAPRFNAHLAATPTVGMRTQQAGPQLEATPRPAVEERPVVMAPPPPAPPLPESELLFPEDHTGAHDTASHRNDPEEDLSIPAFMRRRKKR
ncbi:MAG: cell division protein FtsZ [Candidatus Hydrogenedentales bacterium]